MRRATTTHEGKYGRGLSSLANANASTQDDDDIDSVGELNAPANPLVAAAMATSLYGSGRLTLHGLIIRLTVWKCLFYLRDKVIQTVGEF